MKFIPSAFLLILFQLSLLHATSAQEMKRKVTITIDDLPTVSLLNSPEQKQTITEKLLGTLVAHQIPAIGFVNEMKLYVENNIDTAQVGLLKQWIAAGQELGNHTYSHLSLHKTAPAIYIQEIMKGQLITNKLLSPSGRSVKYFRHPYLHTGNSLEKKIAVEGFLLENNLIVAPVTIDNSDWIFARAYDNAIISGDSVLMTNIGEAYIRYMEHCFSYYEKLSTDLLGYEINQFLLLHANSINADYLDELVKMLSDRGYSFVSTAEGLQDEAYKREEEYVGERGISWIHRWAYTQEKDATFFEGEPETPDFVVQTADLK